MLYGTFETIGYYFSTLWTLMLLMWHGLLIIFLLIRFKTENYLPIVCYIWPMELLNTSPWTKLSPCSIVLNIHQPFEVGLLTHEGEAGCLREKCSRRKSVCIAVRFCVKKSIFSWVYWTEGTSAINTAIYAKRRPSLFSFGYQLPLSLATDERRNPHGTPCSYIPCVSQTWRKRGVQAFDKKDWERFCDATL